MTIDDVPGGWADSIARRDAEIDALCAAEEAGNPVIPDDYAEDEDDLGVCPYFARFESLPGHDPRAICAFGCSDEPQCVTCQPREGWPSFRRWIAERSVA